MDNKKTVKYAVPVVNGKLSMHFGHCEHFAIIEYDLNAKKIITRTDQTPPPHEPGVLPQWLHEMGADIIIAGGMGNRAQMLFEHNGVKVVTGAQETDPEKLVRDYAGGVLETGDNLCDH